MAKERIDELAKELKMPSKSLVKVAKDQGMDIKSHMSSVNPDQAQKLRQIVKAGSNNHIHAKCNKCNISIMQ